MTYEELKVERNKHRETMEKAKKLKNNVVYKMSEHSYKECYRKIKDIFRK